MKLKKTDLGREGTVSCKLFGSEIRLHIPDDEVTEAYAEKCIEAMNNLPDETIDAICRAAKAYCLKYKELLADDDFMEFMTIPITPETPAKEIMKCFAPTVLIIEKPEDDTRTGYQLECRCDWEIEHGMEIDILDDKVVFLSSFEGRSPWYEYDDNDEWNFVNSV